MPDPAPGSEQVSSPEQPVTVVTGATEGLGYALAREFARAGHDLLLVARTPTALDRAAGALARETGVAAHTAAADLSTPAGCAAVEAALREKGLHAAYLVNNAGLGHCGPFAEADPELLTRLVDLNMRAPTALARALLPGMIARGTGGVLNVASLGGLLPGPYQAAYYASKAYVISLSEALARETAGTGVKVAALAPGPVKTGFHERMGGAHSYYIRFQGMMTPERVAKIGYSNFMCGQKLIVPGPANVLSAVALRLLPHTMVTPFAGWLLQKREKDVLNA